MSRIESAGKEVIREIEQSLANARYIRDETEGTERTRLTNLIHGLGFILASYAGLLRKMETAEDVVRAAFLVGIGTEARYREAIDLVQGHLLQYLDVKEEPERRTYGHDEPHWVRTFFDKVRENDVAGEFKQARDMNTNAIHIHAPEGEPLCGTATSLGPTSKAATVTDVLRSRQGERDHWFWCKDCATVFLFSKHAAAFTEKK